MATEHVTLRRAYTEKGRGTASFIDSDPENLKSTSRFDKVPERFPGKEIPGLIPGHSFTMRNGPPLRLLQLLEGHDMEVEFKQGKYDAVAKIKHIYPLAPEAPKALGRDDAVLMKRGVTAHSQHDAILIRIPIDLSKWISES